MATTRGNIGGLINRVVFIFLLFSLIVTVGSLILRHTITVKLDSLSAQLKQPSSNSRISALLLDLDLAENSFQKASSTGDVGQLQDYHNKTTAIFKEISAIIDRYQKGQKTDLPQSSMRLAKILQDKMQLTAQVFELRKSFDSLVKVTTVDKLRGKPVVIARTRTKESKIDSIVSTRKETTNKSLLKRLREAFQPTQSVKVITLKQKSNTTTSVAGKDASGLLTELSSQYGRIAQSAQALVLANLNLLTGLRHLITQLDDIDRMAYQQNREVTLKAYSSAARDLNTFSGVATVAMLVFIFMLFIYVRRAAWAERRLLVESKRAVKLASQKSEILAIMSHEIRNKLMAINGSVFTLKRTELTTQQEQRINNINLASGLILETVNNVLDVSKLEQGYAQTRKSGPFVPGDAIADAVDAMRFMAENKGLQLSFNQQDGVFATVNGDGFKLKQVMLNLLSNALKYTEKGGITVNSQLTEELVLKVEVKDTGAGIPQEEQAKLFTPYYQAAGHKPGTGLGLYLCREMIRNQGGEISLASTYGEGTTISFSIPYQRD
ncbi:HAMP domain-containing histidine kinase [Mucilaginibacter achroorhodeus]|uniref:histidine kinase n=1 Tax=Mucilaginibacter achroorhodeus TaxID=2599294 RepID=A0A563U2P8_9SPHI|nr:HAMP domain-containing sensor histidine kinase [Mucilaginibacter achroorhodeus]TWR25615.1 HAMP domain-containing histidine kinase [Mucilaginibacter achroorhodeus]